MIRVPLGSSRLSGAEHTRPRSATVLSPGSAAGPTVLSLIWSTSAASILARPAWARVGEGRVGLRRVAPAQPSVGGSRRGGTVGVYRPSGSWKFGVASISDTV